MDFSLEGACPIEQAGPDQRYELVAVRGRCVSIEAVCLNSGGSTSAFGDLGDLRPVCGRG